MQFENHWRVVTKAEARMSTNVNVFPEAFARRKTHVTVTFHSGDDIVPSGFTVNELTPVMSLSEWNSGGAVLEDFAH